MTNLEKDKVPVAILGASGIVGQTFAWLLSDHPWFSIAMLAASGRRKGQYLGKDIGWHLPCDIPESLSNLAVVELSHEVLRRKGIKIVFCALPTDIAREYEPFLRESGYKVFSNASVLRQDEDVPLVIPEINAGALDGIIDQSDQDNGFVACNSNCAVSGLSLALAPLVQFGIKRVTVATYQSLSGAGYPGVASLDAAGNVIPNIRSEADKIGPELRKILGIELEVSATCMRVPVPFGHTEAVWVEFETNPSGQCIIDAWHSFGCSGESLPTLPKQPIKYSDNEFFPQPRNAFWGNPPGMPIQIGQLNIDKNCARFVLLVNNLVRGAAGGSIANAETYLVKSGDRG